MFQLNTVESFEVQIPSGEMKSCFVRYPKDEEWRARTRAMKVVRTSLGRDKSVSDVPDQERIDSELFSKIRVDKDGPELDIYEASYVINRIDACRLGEVERDGNHFKISLQVPGGTVEHVLKMPTQKQIVECDRAAPQTIFGRRTTETRMALEPAATLYDAVAVSSSGYAGAVPIGHKWAAVNELLSQISAITSDDAPPEGQCPVL